MTPDLEPATAQSRCETAIMLVLHERCRQDIKWGEQNHPPERWVGILGEEFGEYCEAVNESVFNNGPAARAKGGHNNMMRELSHVAAVAVAAMECLLRDKEKAHDP